MAEIIQLLAPIFTTAVGTVVGTLFGVHLGRRFYGLTDRWEGWAVEIDFIRRALRR